MTDATLVGPPKAKRGSSLAMFRALLVRYLRPQVGRVSLMTVLLLTSIALQLVNPQVIRYFLDTAQAGQAGRPLMIAAVLYILFAILQQGLGLAASFTSKNVGWAATNRLRADLALHLLRLDMTFHKQRTPGELIERVDGDVTQLANFFSEFTVRLLGDSLLALGILALLFRENVMVGLGMVVYTSLTLLVIGWIQRLATPRWMAARQAEAEQNGYIEERISGADEIRAAGAEPYALRRLYAYMRVSLQKVRAAIVVSSLTEGLTRLIYVIGYAAGLALGVYLYTQGQASLGTAYLITYYVGMLSEPLQHIRAQAEDLQQAAASVARINELLDLQPQVKEAAPVNQAAQVTLAAAPVNQAAGAGRELPEGPLGLVFERVSFHYEDNENVLNEVSFEIQPGRVLGILGRTGSGKSTLTRLMFRLYDPDQGAIRLGGTNLRDLPLSALRQRVGMVTQDVQLFHATVRENLTFFNAAYSDAQLESVLRQLRLWEWVQSLPGGLNDRLSAGGQGLSAGEAQLLAFARVFLKDPGLIILDEASSRLDPATETLMERAVDRLFAGRTGVVIAHRLKTVQRADDILILEAGRVVEFGPRLALAADPGSRFYHLLQTGLEEALA